MLHTCSDLVCSGVDPDYLVTNFQLPPDLLVSDVDELAAGISSELKILGADWLGGNTTAGAFHLSATALGSSNKGTYLRRCGCHPGDYVCLTHRAGTQWAAYYAQHRGVYLELGAEARRAHHEAETEPFVPAKPALECARKGLFSGGMDLTDGLGEWIRNLHAITGYSVRLEFHAELVSELALEVADVLGIPRVAFLFEGGYDSPRQHLYTMAPRHFRAAETIFSSLGFPLLPIGEVTEASEDIIVVDGREMPIPPVRDDVFWGYLDQWEQWLCQMAQM